MLMKAFRKFREICKKEVEMNKALHRLAAMPIDYQTIQVICDNVSSGYNVEVTITNNDGSKINIKLFITLTNAHSKFLLSAVPETWAKHCAVSMKVLP